MKKYSIHKDFSWDMGHRITQHGGKCYSPHGHSYRAVVWLESIGLDNQGMVLDFYKLTQVCNPIIEEFDHAFMVSEIDSIMKPFFFTVSGKGLDAIDTEVGRILLGKQMAAPIANGADIGAMKLRDMKPFKYIVVPFETTAENIAKYIFDKVRKELPSVSKVEVWETPKSCAVYEFVEASQFNPRAKIGD